MVRTLTNSREDTVKIGIGFRVRNVFVFVTHSEFPTKDTEKFVILNLKSQTTEVKCLVADSSKEIVYLISN